MHSIFQLPNFHQCYYKTQILYLENWLSWAMKE